MSSIILFLVPEKVWRVNLDAAAESRESSSFDTDERWWDQVELSKLILASNKLQTISESVKLLTALNTLDVSADILWCNYMHVCDLRSLSG